MLSSGHIKCWGSGFYASYTKPDDDPSGVSSITVAGDDHRCILLTGGEVRCWGANNRGGVGDGTTSARYSTVSTGITNGVQVSVGIGGNGGHSCAVLSTGVVKCWGYNSNGQIGNGTSSKINFADWRKLSPVTVSDITTGEQVSAGEEHSCAVLSDHTVMCWGLGDTGQLGDGTYGDAHGTRPTPVQVSGITDATQVSAGAWFSCALLSDHTIKCWGDNSAGQLGNGSEDYSFTTPVTVAGINNAVQISVGQFSSCALLSTGHIKCWGANESGQLGNGTTDGSRTPVPVSGISDATQVRISLDYGCAMVSGGAVKCWGNNDNGQLGDRTATNRSTPVSSYGMSW